MKADKKYQVIWLFGTCFLVLLMVMMGGATRLTRSGLSIVEWNPITGILPPLTPQRWEEAFRQYQKFPEYLLVNAHITLSEFKFIFLMEYAHRLLARLTGLFFLCPLVYFWKNLPAFTKKMCFIALLVGIGQGIMGWYMVKSGLVKNPLVSHYRLAAHLLLALLLYGLLFWSALTLIYPSSLKRAPSLGVCLGGFCLTFTLIYGAFVAGLRAGLIYNTYPLMGGRLIPFEWNFLDPLYMNFLENGATVQWIHRTSALITLVVLLTVMIKVMKKHVFLKKICSLIILWSIIQVSLGILTLLYHVPLFLGICHQIMAVLGLSLMIYLHFCLSRGVLVNLIRQKVIQPL